MSLLGGNIDKDIGNNSADFQTGFIRSTAADAIMLMSNRPYKTITYYSLVVLFTSVR